jgi:uncharacterized protein (TIGR03083 family)
MEIAEHVTALRREGELLATVAAGSDLDAAVPTCPGWRVRDLVSHIGGVHRWAAVYVIEGRAAMLPADEEARVTAAPGDDALVDWYRAGHAALVRTLEDADPTLACWTFLAAPSPLAFWARRQAHETAIHRADAESPRGEITPVPADFGADGVDELLTRFLTRPGGRLRAEEPRTLGVHANDTGDDWLVRIGPDRVLVTRAGGAADCELHAPASDLYLLLWNRRGPEGLDVRGDRSLLALWRESARIRWS